MTTSNIKSNGVATSRAAKKLNKIFVVDNSATEISVDIQQNTKLLHNSNVKV